MNMGFHHCEIHETDAFVFLMFEYFVLCLNFREEPRSGLETLVGRIRPVGHRPYFGDLW